MENRKWKQKNTWQPFVPRIFYTIWVGLLKYFCMSHIMRSSGQLFIRIFLIIFFMSCVYQLFATNNGSLYEGLENIKRRPIIVMGDSAFDNASYVGTTESIPYMLNNHDIIKATMVARDGSSIKELHQQIRSVEKELSNSKQVLFISIGGNDILALKVIDDDITKLVRGLLFKYTQLLANYTIKCKIVLCTIYVPYNKRGTYHAKCIVEWNKQLMVFCKDKKYNLMRLDKLLFEQKDFVEELEPSRTGGKKIVDDMLTFID